MSSTAGAPDRYYLIAAMQIRPERASDIPAIREVNRAAFDSTLEPNLVDALRSDAADVISLVAVDDSEIVGHIMFSPVRVAGAEGLRAMGLAPMAVSPDRQRSGIGSALVRAGLAECASRGVEAVFVVGHPEYYPRFGFTRASTAGVSCEFEVADDAFMVVELVPGSVGGRTGTLHFHEAFQNLS